MFKNAKADDWIVMASALEAAATGLVLFIRPSLFAWLIFEGEFTGAGQALARLAAIALFGLALATWPTPAAAVRAATRALLIYNLLATIYLAYVGHSGLLTGILLWPAAVLHALFSILLGRMWLAAEQRQDLSP